MFKYTYIFIFFYYQRDIQIGCYKHLNENLMLFSRVDSMRLNYHLTLQLLFSPRKNIMDSGQRPTKVLIFSYWLSDLG